MSALCLDLVEHCPFNTAPFNVLMTTGLGERLVFVTPILQLNKLNNQSLHLMELDVLYVTADNIHAYTWPLDTGPLVTVFYAQKST